MSSEIFKRLNLRGFQVGKQIQLVKVVGGLCTGAESSGPLSVPG